MGKSKVVKGVLIVAAAGVIAALMTGILAIAGVFQSDKSKALELLMQAKDRMTWSSTDDYIGSQQLMQNMMQKGSSQDFAISNLEFDLGELFGGDTGGDMSGLSGMFMFPSDLSKYEFDINTQYDAESGRTGSTIMLSKGDNTIGMTGCVGDNEQWFSFPGLLDGKVFHMNDTEKDGDTPDEGSRTFNQKNVYSLLSDMKEFALSKGKSLSESMTCEKIKKRDLGDKGDTGYRLTISKEDAEAAWQEFAQVLKKQTDDLFPEIGESFAQRHVLRDIEIRVYGKDDALCRIETAYPIDGEENVFVLEFSGEKEEAKISFTWKPAEGDLFSFAAELTDKAGEKCEKTFHLTIEEEKETVAQITVSESLVTDTGDYEANGELKFGDTDPVKFSAHGSVKDLKPGTCVNYVFDDVSISVGDTEMVHMALKMKLASLEGNLEPPLGEMIEVSGENASEELEPYLEELQSNLQTAITKMDLPGSFLMFLPNLSSAGNGGIS